MRKQGSVALIITLGCLLMLSGCVSNIWTGATLIYGRHNTYLKINDFQLNASANRALYKDLLFKQDDIAIELAVFNRDVLMVGHVPTLVLRQEAYARVDAATPEKRRFFNQLVVGKTPDNTVQDAWITTKIRSHILANSDINPDAFKIVTSGRIVYLMGDVIPDQAQKVILFARECRGVKRVVKLLKYYHLSDHPALFPSS